jgi:hypothetical protein
MIAVFINNKLISTDTILPLVMELHRTAETGPIRFYTSSQFTYDEICLNTVLYDAIQSVGEFCFIGAKSRTLPARLLSRLLFLPLILKFFFAARMGQLTIIHFGILDVWPFRMLYYVARNRTFKFEQTPIGHSQKESEIDSIERVRKPLLAKPAACMSVGFRHMEASGILLDSETAPPTLFHPPVFRTKAWTDFVEAHSDGYLNQDFDRAGVAPKSEILTFMLGYFGKLDFLISESIQLELFHKTIETLLEVGEGRPIFLKPHVITNREVLKDALMRYRGKSIIVSYLHPAVLASRSRLFVASYYSTTLSIAKGMGVPTIEFSGYTDKALALTKDGSMRPELVDHFVNLDRTAFRNVVQSVLARSDTMARNNSVTHPIDPALCDLLTHNASVSDIIKTPQPV